MCGSASLGRLGTCARFFCRSFPFLVWSSQKLPFGCRGNGDPNKELRAVQEARLGPLTSRVTPGPAHSTTFPQRREGRPSLSFPGVLSPSLRGWCLASPTQPVLGLASQPKKLYGNKQVGRHQVHHTSPYICCHKIGGRTQVARGHTLATDRFPWV